MWNKIKAFFENGTVKIVEAVVIALASAGLIVGGIKIEQIQSIPALAGGVVTAIEAIITFIQGLVALKNAKKE